ncbi:unnamed protein product, partial [marine sediment metagenome]
KYYMSPKQNQFRIKDFIYITNPEKTTNLSEDTKQNVLDSILKKKERLRLRIADYTARKKAATAEAI